MGKNLLYQFMQHKKALLDFLLCVRQKETKMEESKAKKCSRAIIDTKEIEFSPKRQKKKSWERENGNCEQAVIN